MLRGDELSLLLDRIHSLFHVSAGAEITLEANPDDLTDAKLRQLRERGINRLSVGIQSFDDSVLIYLNRAHGASDAIESFHRAREAGFSNISIDLMYSIPAQTESSFRRSVAHAIALAPEHISLYCLTLEQKTAFGKWEQAGKWYPVNEETSALQFEFLMDELQGAGYQHYEISNFCRPGFQSRHNSNYWRQEKYIGIGPGAHSYNRETRQFNVRNNPIYIRSLEGGSVPFEREILTRENRINEFLFTSLRTSWGCDLDQMKRQFDFDLLSNSRPYIDDLVQRKLAVIDRRTLTLTRAGKLLADQIASDLFVETPADS